MAEVVTMPKLGFDMAEGTLVRWVANEGDNVTKGAVLAEIETDKATVEVESNFDGVLLKQLVPQGTVVPINDPIGVIGAAGETVNVDELLGKQGGAEKPKEAAEVEQADKPEKPEKPEKPVEETEPKQEQAAKQPAEEKSKTPAAVEVQVPQPMGETPNASPLARSMAAELGINLGSVRGSGPGGRITKKDIEAYQQKAPEAPAPVAVAPKAPSATPAPAAGAAQAFIRERRTTPIPRLRSAIGRRMTESMQQAPHFYVTHTYDVENLLEQRKKINELLAEEDKLSVNDFIVKAVALTLLEFPNLNASLDAGKTNLITHGEINVGVAVAVENGLLTVVSRNTDQKTISQISTELKTMVKRAREGKVRQDDIEGSTFTVSNLGMYDVDQFTAIINPPEAAILAVGSAMQIPVVVDGRIEIGNRMKATLSVDHRISDGAEGARFLQALAKYIEEPLRLLL